MPYQAMTDPATIFIAILCLIIGGMFVYAGWKTRKPVWLLLGSITWIFIGFSIMMLFAGPG